MKNLSVITRLPEVVGAVVSDPGGAVIEWTENLDGESTAAVHAFAIQSLSRAGESLGLGPIQQMVISAKRSTCLVFPRGDVVLGIYVDPNKPLSMVEKKLHETLG
jgi:predicted regulator of Ras-like GTPase activity (Roadblock/LC7/MglB family)